MRIGTWNVEYGRGSRNSDRLAILRDRDAAIWVLTETCADLDLGATHPHAMSTFPRTVRQFGSQSVWVTIWSKYPMVRTISVPDPRRMVAAIFDSPAGPLAVAGIVLPWHCDVGDRPPDPRPRNWEEHRRVLRDEVPELLEILRGQSAAGRILAGDFNTDFQPPHSYGLKVERAALLALLTDAAFTCHTGSMLYPPPGSNRTLIDHICSDLESIGEVETWSGDDGEKPRLSDHPGVVVTLKFPNPATA